MDSYILAQFDSYYPRLFEKSHTPDASGVFLFNVCTLFGWLVTVSCEPIQLAAD